jgi:hypothetical protein
MPAPVDVLKQMASSAWYRLRAARALGISQSEETLTDIALLDVKLQESKEIALWKATKRDEARLAVDWEWFIGNDTAGWYRYAVQAKKLTLGRYKTLNQSVRRRGIPPIRQIDVLEQYATANNAIPLYLFYNYVEQPIQMNIWLQAEVSQLGCTLTPLQSVRAMLESAKQPAFDDVYRDRFTIPLYRILSLTRKDHTDLYHDAACHYPRLPDSVLAKIAVEQPAKARKTAKAKAKKSASYRRVVGESDTVQTAEITIAPRRVMVIRV